MKKLETIENNIITIYNGEKDRVYELLQLNNYWLIVKHNEESRPWFQWNERLDAVPEFVVEEG
jgi:hypothetical protein